MQFLVIGRHIDSPVAPPAQEIAMLKATFEQFASGRNPKIKAVYPFADERATGLWSMWNRRTSSGASSAHYLPRVCRSSSRIQS